MDRDQMVAQQENGGVGEKMSQLSVGGQGALVPVSQARTVLPKPDLPALETQTLPVGIIK